MAASLVRLHAGFGPVPHIFCGQNCEQGPWPGSKPLIPKGKLSLLKIYAEQGFPQLPPCAAAFFLFPTGRKSGMDNFSGFAHKLWKRM
jgi:hypothetical protein